MFLKIFHVGFLFEGFVFEPYVYFKLHAEIPESQQFNINLWKGRYIEFGPQITKDDLFILPALC